MNQRALSRAQAALPLLLQDPSGWKSLWITPTTEVIWHTFEAHRVSLWRLVRHPPFNNQLFPLPSPSVVCMLEGEGDFCLASTSLWHATKFTHIERGDGQIIDADMVGAVKIPEHPIVFLTVSADKDNEAHARFGPMPNWRVHEFVRGLRAHFPLPSST